MIRLKIAFFILFVVAISCKTRKEGEIRISGKAHFAKPGTLYLERLVNDKFEIIDSVKLNDKQSFEIYTVVDTPEFYRLNFYNQFPSIVYLGKDDINIEVDSSGLIKGSGSKEIEDLVRIRIISNEVIQKQEELQKSMYQALQDGNNEKMAELRDEIGSLEQEFKGKVKEAILGMDGRLTALFAVRSFFRVESEADFYGKLISLLKEKNPDSYHVKELEEYYDEAKKLAVGAEAPDLEMENPDGKLISLSSFRGKVVLLDFWAAWCGPCRAQNPELVRIYDKYEDKGFEILGVSLDKNREDWIKAIEDDHLSWPQISDLKHFGSASVPLYKIQGIPTSFLIDREGKIIARDFRANELEKLLEANL